MKFLFVRHGEIPSNVNKVYAGRSAEQLTEKGAAQANEVAGILKNRDVHAIYTSPIQRAVQTAKVIGETIGLDFNTEYSFRELEMGLWEGMAETDVANQYPKEWQVWNSMPAELRLDGRETLEDLLERVLNGIRTIYMSDNDRTVVVVTHVAIIRVILLWHAKKSLNLYKTIHVPNAEVFEIDLASSP